MSPVGAAVTVCRLSEELHLEYVCNPLSAGAAAAAWAHGLVARLRRRRSDGRAAVGLFPCVHDSADALAALRNVWEELCRYARSPSGNRLSQLAAYALVLFGAPAARGIESERRALPLVMGRQLQPQVRRTGGALPGRPPPRSL